MRVSLRPFLACSLAIALGLPGSALAAPSKSKSSKSATKGEGAAKDPAAAKDPGDPSVPPVTHDGPPRVGRVWVDAEGISGGAELAVRTMRAATGGLESQAVTITEALAGPELRVKLTERDAGGYRVEYEIVYDGKTIKNGTGGFDCQLCTEDELVEKVEALAIQVSPKLVVPQEEPGPDPDVKDPDADPDGLDIGPETDPNDPTTDEDPSKLGIKGKAGIGLLVAGGVGTIGGVVLLAIKPIPVEDDPLRATMATSTKPFGGLVLGVGVAVLATGAVLLALDRKQAKAKPKKAAAMVHPWIGADGGGLGLSGRF